MGQSASKSLLEATANSAVAMTYAVVFYMWMGFTAQEGLAFTAVFAVVGFIRVFLIRRLFEWRNKS